VPVCHALANDPDGIFMMLVVWPLLLVMLFQRHCYLAWRSQLVAAARVATLCVPPLLFLLLPRHMQHQHLERRGVWLDKPGGGLAVAAAHFGLQELQLKQLLSLLATAWMEHALLVGPAFTHCFPAAACQPVCYLPQRTDAMPATGPHMLPSWQQHLNPCSCRPCASHMPP
jgi:hypothetical protein